MEGFGPNDSQVLRFLGDVSKLTLEQARELARLRRPDDDPERMNASRMVDRAALMSDRAGALEAARDAIRATARFRGMPWFGRARRVYWRRISPHQVDTMLSAMPALLDVIGALVVRDLLEQRDFDILHAPWVGAQAASMEQGLR